MSLKIKLISCISAFVVVLSLMLISVFAATNVTLNIGGNVSFTANSVNALITGSIAGNVAGGSTLTTIDIDASDPNGPVSMPSDWTSMDLTFTESANPITVTINIQNRSTDRGIEVSLTDSTNISNVTVTRECDGASINASDSRNIPGGETITYTFELNVQSQNSSANGAFNLAIGLETPGPQTYKYFTFEENEDGKTVTLTDYNPSSSNSTDITIPSTVSQNASGEWVEGNTYTVTAIDNNTTSSSNSIFYNSGITSVKLPSTLQSIGSYAFYGCSGLTSVDLSECTSLTSIGSSAFCACSGLTSTILPSSLISIGKNAFSSSGNMLTLDLSRCVNLTSIGEHAFWSSKILSLDLSNCVNLTSIGEYAFRDCTILSLDLSNCLSLTTLFDNTFWGCVNLTSIALPPNLTSIESSYVFRECYALAEVYNYSSLSVGGYIENEKVIYNANDLVLGKPESRIHIIDDIQYYIYENDFIALAPSIPNNTITSVTLDSKTTEIGSYAFYGCRNLTSFNVSSCANLTIIGEYAFMFCGVTTLDFSSCINLTTIEQDAFYSSELQTIDFSGCTNLKFIEDNIFINCSDLKSVIFSGIATGWYVTTSPTATSGTSVNLSNSSTNVTYFTDTYRVYYFKRNI